MAPEDEARERGRALVDPYPLFDYAERLQRVVGALRAAERRGAERMKQRAFDAIRTEFPEAPTHSQDEVFDSVERAIRALEVDDGE